MFEWDRNNLSKLRKHRLTREEAEQVLFNNPLLIHEEDVEGEVRFIYYGETEAGRPLAVIVTERLESLRVITAYGLNARQRRHYHQRRTEGE